MRAAVVLLTRDLRVHDNPGLAAACREAETVLPLFVHDPAAGGAPGGSDAARGRFLRASLADLDASLRALGGALDVRRGDTVAETVRAARAVGAEAVFLARDVTPYARRRERRLGAAVPLRLVDAHFVQPPGEVAPSGRDHYQVFSAYHRAWAALEPGLPLPPPPRVQLPAGRLPEPPAAPVAEDGWARGGETEGRRRLEAWLRTGLGGYEDAHDVPAADGTSRLSPWLHLGCVSARELAVRAASAGGAAFVRQLCWRDFFAQLLRANPHSAVEDLRPRGDRWLDAPDRLDAWREGRTGYPLVDAGMRQLRAEGWMHNRVRLVTASFLVKHLGVDWRAGAAHFGELLLDGDLAQNVGNWQWVAGTGVDTRPNRVFNPTAQARRLDPDGAYVRRWVPELAGAESPWAPGLLAPAYPPPIVDHAEAVAAFRARRGG